MSERINVTVGLLALAAAACSAPAPERAADEGGSEPAIVDMSGVGSVAPGNSVDMTPTTPLVPSDTGSEVAAPVVPQPMDIVLDAFDDGDGEFTSAAGFSGRWRTYSDGTGSVTPAVGTPIVPVDGALHVSGMGFSTWGVGVSVDLDTGMGARRCGERVRRLVA